MNFDIIFFTALISFFIVVASYDYFEFKTGVPTFPTMPAVPAVRRRMIEILKNDMETRKIKSHSIIDLGSGSGQLLWHIAKAMPKVRVVGVELSYIPWLRSVMRQRLFGPANLRYERLDFWPYDVSGFDAVITYLPGKIMERVGEKLNKELKPGTMVIANGFPLQAGWQPYETMTVRVPFKMKMFVYAKS
ncbi:MAG: class I SAM-dependent methyltransferase [Alphaproteobacteria bacterium]|nr:class I SAM-dependent methyltransferase [Alphaproteobacteria bacterium]